MEIEKTYSKNNKEKKHKSNFLAKTFLFLSIVGGTMYLGDTLNIKDEAYNLVGKISPKIEQNYNNKKTDDSLKYILTQPLSREQKEMLIDKEISETNFKEKTLDKFVNAIGYNKYEFQTYKRFSDYTKERIWDNMLIKKKDEISHRFKKEWEGFFYVVKRKISKIFDSGLRLHYDLNDKEKSKKESSSPEDNNSKNYGQLKNVNHNMDK